MPTPLRQRELSTRLDSRKLRDALSDASSLSERQRAQWRLAALPGAGAWLQAQPSQSLGLAIASHLFASLLRRRLGMPVYDAPSTCALCGSPADIYGDHAVACPCAGDRTRRHHRVRDCLAHIAASAGHAPSVEPIGLLPPRPHTAGGAEDGSAPRRDSAGELRRPADVYLAHWWGGRAAAFDVALTSGLLPRSVAASAADASVPLSQYDAYKRRHLGTEAACRDAGITFVPFVMDADGGYGAGALAVLAKLADDAVVFSGADRSSKAAHNKQAIAVAVARCNAVAIARRRAQPRKQAKKNDFCLVKTKKN